MTLITDTASPASAANTMQHTEHVMGGRGSPPRTRRLRHPPPPPPPAGGPRARPRRTPRRAAPPRGARLHLPGQPGSAPPASPELRRGRCQPPCRGSRGSDHRGRAPGAAGGRRAVRCRWRHSRRAVAGQPAHLRCSLRTETFTSASSVRLVRCSQTSSVCGFKGFSEAFGPMYEFTTNKLNFSGHITADFLETDFFRTDFREAGCHSTVTTKKI